MQSSNIPDSEIAAFADPNHWLNYFPPLAKRDVGLMVRQEAQARPRLESTTTPVFIKKYDCVCEKGMITVLSM